MAESKNHFWAAARRGFRWTRILLLAAMAIAVAGVLWMNLIGLPRWLQRQIERQISSQEYEVSVTRMRLAGLRKLYAVDLRLDSKDNSSAFSSVTVPRAEVLLDWSHFPSPEVAGVVVRRAAFDMPLGPPGSPGNSLLVTNINAEVRLLPRDVWEIHQLEGEAFGAKATGFASLTNVARWVRRQAAAPKTPAADWRANLRRYVALARQIGFEKSPAIVLSLSGDLANPATCRVSLRVEGTRLTAPWGSVQDLQFLASLHPASGNLYNGALRLNLNDLTSRGSVIRKITARGESLWNTNFSQLATNLLSISMEDVETRWGSAPKIDALLRSGPGASPGLIDSSFNLSSSPAEIFGVRTGTNFIALEVHHPLPFPAPALLLDPALHATNVVQADLQTRQHISGRWSYTTPIISTRKLVSEKIALTGEIKPRPTEFTEPLSGFWRWIAPFELPWHCTFSNLLAENVNIGSLNAEGSWLAPQLLITSMQAELYGGAMTASGGFDAFSGALSAQTESRFDYHKTAVLLDAPVQRWLAQFSWTNPPAVQADLRLQLPSGYFFTPEWNRKLASNLQLSGRVEGSGAFREAAVDHFLSSFAFSNFVWRLPDLVLEKSGRQARIDYTGDVSSGEFQALLDSELDPAILRPLFPAEQQIAFEMVRFPQPPRLKGKATGDWDLPEQIAFSGDLAATNFIIKGELFSGAAASLVYSNLMVELANIAAWRGQETVTAPYGLVNIPGEVMFVTNAVSTMNPWLAMSLVGPDVYDAIDPYRFEHPPLVKINGHVPLRHWSKADLHFNVAGTNFTYWNFNMPRLAGDVFWKADHISFSNVVANFYGGDGRWSGHFYINDQHSADFSFHALVSGSDLKALLSDLTPGSNQMEGKMKGELVITSANSDDPLSWTGHGKAVIEEGFLWKVPVFGVFLRLIDAVVPGASVAGITSAEGAFTITNSVVHTRDLQVKAPAFRLNYKGQVDLEGNLDAKVEAEILRDFWIVGKVFSTVLWPVSKIFEAEIDGTVQQPRTNLKHFPSFPFRRQRENSPPAASRPPPAQSNGP